MENNSTPAAAEKNAPELGASERDIAIRALSDLVMPPVLTLRERQIVDIAVSRAKQEMLIALHDSRVFDL